MDRAISIRSRRSADEEASRGEVHRQSPGIYGSRERTPSCRASARVGPASESSGSCAKVGGSQRRSRQSCQEAGEAHSWLGPSVGRFRS